MLAWIMSLIMSGLFVSGIHGMTVTPAPNTAQHTPDNSTMEDNDDEWQAFHAEAYAEYSDEFTALYNGLQTRWSKNGRLMMRNGDSGSYKFVRRAA